MGVPIGMVIDAKGPRPAVMLGSFLLGLGYYPIKLAFDAGAGSVAWMCVVSYLTGLGGCMAFMAAVKASALNWPHHRGTATAFPLAAFGLSAFFFSVFGTVFFPGNTSAFLMALSVGTFTLTFIGFFFLRVLPHSSYHALHSEASGMTDSQRLRRTSSEDGKAYRAANSYVEPGMSSTETNTSTADSEPTAQVEVPRSSHKPEDIEAAAVAEEADETSSLMSSSSAASSYVGDVLLESSVDMDRSHRVDIRGWRLLRNIEFWQIWAIMGILSGVGLMTIK